MIDNIKKDLTMRKDEIVYVLVITFIWSMAGHAFAYFNLMPQGDSISHMLKLSGRWEISLGRFLLPVFDRIRYTWGTTWLVGIFPILYIAIGCYIICDVLEFDKFNTLIVSGILAANISIAEINSTFFYVLDAYMLSAMLALLGTYLLIRGENALSFVGAVIFMIMSLGIYQSEIMLAILLIIFYIISCTIDNNLEELRLRRIIRYLGGLFFAGVLYYSIYKLLLKFLGIPEPLSYNGLANLQDLTVKKMVIDIFGNIKYLGSRFLGEYVMLGNFSVYATGCWLYRFSSSCFSI